MNKALVFTILALTGFSSLSEGGTLFSSSNENGGFGAVVIKAASIEGSVDQLSGIRIGWIVNHSFILSGGFYSLTSTAAAPVKARENFSGSRLKLTMDYWGAEFEYVLMPERIVHFSVYSFLGTGNIGYIDQYDNDFNIKDGVYVFEPAINGTININRWFRVSAGVSYRMVSDISLVDLSNSNMSGVSGNLTLRFGKF